MTYEAVGDYLSKTNRSPGQKVSSSTFLLQQIAKEEKTKEQKSSPEEISVERVEQIPKKLFGEEVNKEIDYVKDLLKMQVEEEDVAGKSQCLKIIEKVAFNIASEASYVYIPSRQKLIKNGPFWRVDEHLKLKVKQCYQTGTF